MDISFDTGGTDKADSPLARRRLDRQNSPRCRSRLEENVESHLPLR
jgi:hypothetical protein